MLLLAAPAAALLILDSGAATETWWYISYEMPHLKFILVTCTTFHIFPFFSSWEQETIWTDGRTGGRAF